jgi:hypothetical protein
MTNKDVFCIEMYDYIKYLSKPNSPLSTGDDGDVSKASISDVQSPSCKPETLGDTSPSKGEKA